MSLVPKPKDILRNVVVATAGDLGNPDFDDVGVKRYVTSWGGRFSADFDESVTHLLVSKSELKAKRNHPLGRRTPWTCVLSRLISTHEQRHRRGFKRGDDFTNLETPFP